MRVSSSVTGGYKWSAGKLSKIEQRGSFATRTDVLSWDLLRIDRKSETIKLGPKFAFSHNRKWLASTYFPVSQLSQSRRKLSNVTVVDVEKRTELSSKVFAQKREIGDIAWAPTDEYVALVTFDQRLGWWHHELLEALLGHPVPHNDYYVEIFTRALEPIMTIPIAEDVGYGAAFITWTEDSTSPRLE